MKKSNLTKKSILMKMSNLMEMSNLRKKSNLQKSQNWEKCQIINVASTSPTSSHSLHLVSHFCWTERKFCEIKRKQTGLWKSNNCDLVAELETWAASRWNFSFNSQSRWKWMNVDESGWKWIKVDKGGWKWFKVNKS